MIGVELSTFTTVIVYAKSQVAAKSYLENSEDSPRPLTRSDEDHRENLTGS